MKDKQNFGSISPTGFTKFNELIKELGINTICNSGLCPNRPECFKNKQLTFLILGDICTRSCKFCGVKHGKPLPIDLNEPNKIAKAVTFLGLKYVVITSVTRDDIPDGGASQFIDTIKKVRELNPGIEIEVLIPDFKFNIESIKKIILCRPAVINHNIECCEKNFREIRPEGNYTASLRLMRHIKEKYPNILTKSGFMLGVGESMEDIKKTLNDLKTSRVDIITIGQYLPPTKNSFSIKKRYTKREFDEIKKYTLKLGFKAVFIGSKIRSSYHAGEQIVNNINKIKSGGNKNGS